MAGESPRGARSANTAFVAVGIMFLVLSLTTDTIAFLPVGIVFLALSARREPADDGEDETPPAE